MTKVYVVHWESGQYSDYCYAVCGVFSSREKAVAYIESQSIVTRPRFFGPRELVNPNKPDYYMPLREYENREDADVVVTPTTKDGITFQYISPLGSEVEHGYGPRVYHVTEYEMDVPNVMERDACQST